MANRTLTLNSSRFSGVLAPVITPFNEELRPDHGRFLKHCQWLVSQGVGLAVFGTNSEANSLSLVEKKDLLTTLVEGGIDPALMMPGTGSCALPDAIELTDHAVKLGCGGVLMLPPFYYKGVADDGLVSFFSEVIEGVDNPALRVYLYHIPPVANVPIPQTVIKQLAEKYPSHIAGIKDSSGDWSHTQALNELGIEDFRVFCGSESFLLKNMQAGGAGCISATANVNPGAIRALYDQWQTADAEKLQAELDKIRGIFQSRPMIPALKAATAIYGDDPTWFRVRPPLQPLAVNQRDELRQELSATNFQMPDI